MKLVSFEVQTRLGRFERIGALAREKGVLALALENPPGDAQALAGIGVVRPHPDAAELPQRDLLGAVVEQHGVQRVAALHGIINCAAFASFAWKPDIWEINVEHTSVFARAAAALPQLTRFVHVGTAMISGSAADCVVQEDEVLDRRRQLVPYTRSKAEIEYRLPQWLDGDRLVIARPLV